MNSLPLLRLCLLFYALEDYFQSKILISPFMANNALIKLDHSFVDMDFDRKWKIIGNFHLKVENWSHKVYSHPKFILGYGVSFC